jgi:hypothetical protein
VRVVGDVQLVLQLGSSEHMRPAVAEKWDLLSNENLVTLLSLLVAAIALARLHSCLGFMLYILR